MRTLTAAMMKFQESGIPIHKWELAEIPARSDWIDNYKTVEQFMITDLFTVRPQDVVELAVKLMDWKHVRHVPVENDAGELIGLITMRDLAVRWGARSDDRGRLVRDVMRTRITTVEPATPTLEALRLMRENRIGCLPVVQEGKLLGIITEYDFLTVSCKLLEERLSQVLEEDGGSAGAVAFHQAASN
jgi:CBS domain-containing protein